MTLTVILVILASALSGVTFYYGGYYHSMAWVWLPFALAIAYFWGLFLVHALYMAAFSFIIKHSKKEDYKPNRYAMWMLGETCHILLMLFRVRVHATGLGKIPSPKTKFMIVSNHLSGFDHVGLISCFVRHRMICVSKMKNLSTPVAGGWIKFAGYLNIVQDDVVSGTKLIERAGEYIKEGNCSVCIAPEGTRNKDFPEPEILPFKPGAFQMAYIARCPIVVFAIQNTNCVLKRFPLRGTDAYYDCVAVIDYEDYKDLTPAELAKKVEGYIARRFEQKRARFYHLKPKKAEEEATK